MGLNLLQEIRLKAWGDTPQLIDDNAVYKKVKGWDTLNTVLHSDLTLLVYVDLADLKLAIIIQGDLIQVESADTARVLAVDYATGLLSLSGAINWQSGDGVGYPYMGSRPDIGAMEYDPAILGDTDGDGTVDVADIVYLVSYVFKSGPAPKGTDSGDVNCDRATDVEDIIDLVNYVFKSGPKPECP